MARHAAAPHPQRLVVLALLVVVPLMVDRVRLLEASRAERINDAAAEVDGASRSPSLLHAR